MSNQDSSAGLHLEGARRRFDKGRRRVSEAELNEEVGAGDRRPSTERMAEFAQPDTDSTPRPLTLGKIKLVVEQGRRLGEQYLLTEPNTLVGRFDPESSTCPDIDLSAQDSAFVHRRHARLCHDSRDESLWLVDLGGRNGTFVNNQQLPPNSSEQLKVGDKVRIGRVVLRVKLAPEMTRSTRTET